MPIKNSAITVQYVAWDTANNVGKTGDAGNHTLRGVGDGTEYTPAASPSEVDSANAPGVYKVAIAAGENNYNVVTLVGKSSTAGIVIIPITWTNDSPPGIRKNVALNNFEFPMVSSSDHVTRVSGATVTVKLNLDGGSDTTSTNSASEIGTTGKYKINLAAADLNANVIGFTASATGCDDTMLTIITQP